jgi:hypothetical protein
MNGKASIRQNISSLDTTSPVRMLLVLMSAVFLVELCIMGAFSLLPPIPEWGKNFLDAAILSTLLFPALYILGIPPLDPVN